MHLPEILLDDITGICCISVSLPSTLWESTGDFFKAICELIKQNFGSHKISGGPQILDNLFWEEMALQKHMVLWTTPLSAPGQNFLIHHILAAQWQSLHKNIWWQMLPLDRKITLILSQTAYLVPSSATSTRTLCMDCSLCVAHRRKKLYTEQLERNWMLCLGFTWGFVWFFGCLFSFLFAFFLIMHTGKSPIVPRKRKWPRN